MTSTSRDTAIRSLYRVARIGLKRSLLYAEEANDSLIQVTVIEGDTAETPCRMDTFDAMDALIKAIKAMDTAIDS